MVPSPIGSHFCLELCLYPLPQQATAEQHERNKRERMAAIFSTYDPEGERYASRQPFTYAGRIYKTPVPAGSFSFSRQLKNVQFANFAPDDIQWSGVEARNQRTFSR